MKTFTYKKSAILLTMVFVFALISSCKKDDDFQPVVYGNAKISVTNAAAGSNSQDFFQNDTKLTTTAVAMVKLVLI